MMGTLFAFSQLYIGLTQNARHNLGIFPAGEMEAVPVWACRYGLDPQSWRTPRCLLPSV